MLQPTHDLVFIEKRTKTQELSSIIVIPDNAGEQEDIGTIVMAGPGKTYSNGNIVPLTVKVGDEVIFSKHAGQSFKIGDKTLLALREDDIYAVIREAPDATA